MSDYIVVRSDGYELVIDHLYNVENYCTFKVFVKSGEFAGASNFCVSKELIAAGIEKTGEMKAKLNGRFELKDFDSDANLVFELGKFGHMDIFGQIGGSHEEHFMRFRFTTDQTTLNGFIRSLRGLYTNHI